MRFERIYLDSNILIRAFEASPDDDTARDIIDMLGQEFAKTDKAFVTSQITLAEVLVHPIRKGDTFLQHQYGSLLSTPSPWIDIRPIDAPILHLAARLRASTRLKLPDAIHAATALQTKCSHLLTLDSDFDVNLVGAWPSWPQQIHPAKDVLATIIAWLRA